MSSQAELWTEAGGALTVAALLPFYIGCLHLSLLDLFLYALFATAAMTAGEHTQFSSWRGLTVSDFLSDMTLWGQLVLVTGLTSYVLALILI